MKSIYLIALHLIFTSSNVAFATGWLGYGDFRGHVEPCGCDPTSDLGGFRRLAALVRDDRLQDNELGVFSLGNNVPGEVLTQTSQRKLQLAFEVERLLKPDAILFNDLEQRLPKELFDLSPNRDRYVLSNLEKGHKLKIAGVIETSKFLIFGYAKNGPLKALGVSDKNWLKQVPKSTKKTRVLLFAGSDNDLEKLKNMTLFDVIVASNKNPIETPADGRERLHPEQLLRMQPNIYQVPFGGQGVVRGGGLEDVLPAKLLAKSLSVNKKTVQPQCLTPNAWMLDACKDALKKELHNIVWLTKDFALTDTVVEPAFATYEKAVADEFEKNAAAKLKDITNSPYMGAQACQGCHKQDFEIWSKSKHSHAMDTLTNAKKDQDGECVSCHSVGFGKQGGFLNLKHTPNLANVQCENCHGARREHVESGGVKKGQNLYSAQKPSEVCTNCHVGQHSPKFDWEQYWKTIQHGNSRKTAQPPG